MPKQEVAKKRSIRSACHVAAALLLPGTWLGRLSFFCFALLPWSTSGTWISVFGGGALIFGFAAAYDRWMDSSFVMVIISIACVGAVGGGIYLLTELATGGSTALEGTGQKTNVASVSGIFAAMAIMWLVLGVPNRAHALELDVQGEGSARRVAVKLLVAVSCALSALIVLLLYFGAGPLPKPKLGLVLVGILFMAVLLAPYYRKAADAVWKHGFPGVVTNLRYLWESWGPVLDELGKAVRSNDNVTSAAEDDPAISSPCQQTPDSKSAAPDA